MCNELGRAFTGSFGQAMALKKFLQGFLSIPFKIPQCVVQIE